MDSSLVRFCQRLQSVAKLFRFVELCIALVFISWLSTRLPFAVRISGEYFRRFAAFIFSPTSIFLLGNAIIVTLLAKSGLFSAGFSPAVDNAVAEFCQDFRSENPGENIAPAIVYQDKEIICQENTKMASSDVDERENVFPVPEKQAEVKGSSYLRSKSEKLRREKKEKLRRSETDICWRDFTGAGEEDYPADDEEFRRTIEAFIARQVRFHREERLAVVLHGQA